MSTDKHFIDIHTHSVTNPDCISVLNVFAGAALPQELTVNVFFSVGIHPWYMDNWENKIESLQAAASHTRIIAIGECGFDKNVDQSLDLQEYVFKSHIMVSESLRKPIIVHCVKAYDELIRLRKTMSPTMPWIIHGFNKSPELGMQCIEHGFILSFGKALFNHPGSISLLNIIPEDKFFLETEDSNLDISMVYERCAEIRNTNSDQISQVVRVNFSKYFNFDPWG